MLPQTSVLASVPWVKPIWDMSATSQDAGGYLTYLVRRPGAFDVLGDHLERALRQLCASIESRKQ
jgi:hypothetical protein